MCVYAKREERANKPKTRVVIVLTRSSSLPLVSPCIPLYTLVSSSISTFTHRKGRCYQHKVTVCGIHDITLHLLSTGYLPHKNPCLFELLEDGYARSVLYVCACVLVCMCVHVCTYCIVCMCVLVCMCMYVRVCVYVYVRVIVREERDGV